MKNQADRFRYAINLSKLTAFFVVTNVGKDGPLAIIRRIGGPLVTDLIGSVI